MANKDDFQKMKTDLIAQNENTYGKEVRERFGDKAMDESNRKLTGLSEEQWQHQQQLGCRVPSSGRARYR